MDHPETLPPLCSPAWCDHGPIAKLCSRCDPSPEAGRRRAKEAAAELARLNSAGWLKASKSEDMGAAVEQER